jgi:hypothetical protein
MASDKMVRLLQDGLDRGLSLMDVPRDKFGCCYGCMRLPGEGHVQGSACMEAFRQLSEEKGRKVLNLNLASPPIPTMGVSDRVRQKA